MTKREAAERLGAVVARHVKDPVAQLELLDAIALFTTAAVGMLVAEMTRVSREPIADRFDLGGES